MALVRQFRRSKRLAGRPEWQDVVPDTKEGRTAYKIAAKHQVAFSRAFLRLTRNLLPDEMPKEFKEFYDKFNPDSIIAQYIFFDEENPVWASFEDSLYKVYYKIIEESGQVATRELSKKLNKKFRFTMYDGRSEVVEQFIKLVDDVGVQINPYSIEWIRSHSLELIREGLSIEQSNVVRMLLDVGYSEGLRAENTYNLVKENIGLTDKELGAIEKRYSLHIAQGLSEEKATILTNKYREKLLKQRAQRIARTETIKAQAKGRQQVWQMAVDEGDLPETVVRVWITPPSSPNPNRPCAICRELDGREAPLDGFYESTKLGAVEGPPAHPHCRCTETIETKEVRHE